MLPPPPPPPSRAPFAAFAAIWFAALATMKFGGRSSDVLPAIGTLLGVALFGGVIARITQSSTQVLVTLPLSPRRRRRLWLQLFWLAIAIAATGWSGLHFHQVVTAPVPIWSTIVDAAGNLGERSLPADWVGSPHNALANPTAYLLLPLAGLLALGARWRTLGCGRGHRVALTTTLVCALPVAWIAWNAPPLPRLAGALLSNTLQNGPFEEFLFRGAMQTRLVPLLGRTWAVGIQALAFGLWHLGAATAESGNLWTAAASTVVFQGVTGWLFGLLALRTGNLWASSVLHVVANTAASCG